MSGRDQRQRRRQRCRRARDRQERGGQQPGEECHLWPRPQLGAHCSRRGLLWWVLQGDKPRGTVGWLEEPNKVGSGGVCEFRDASCTPFLVSSPPFITLQASCCCHNSLPSSGAVSPLPPPLPRTPAYPSPVIIHPCPCPFALLLQASNLTSGRWGCRWAP